jgi:PAS domain S-box-containing protein
MPFSYHRDAHFIAAGQHAVRRRPVAHFASGSPSIEHRRAPLHDRDLILRNTISWPRYVLTVAVLAVIYALAGRLGFSASAVHPIVSSAWPPSGVGLAALLLLGRRFWPGILLGAFLVNMSGNVHPLGALSIAIGNSVEALVGAWLLSRFAEFRPSMERLQDVFGIVLAAIASTPISATVGVTTLYVLGGVSGVSYGTVWLTWFTGDAIGILLITPLVLAWATGPRLRVTSRDVAEATVLGVLLIAFAVVLFQTRFSYVYAIFPVTIWAALRFGPRGATAASLVVSVLAIGYTLTGVGPFGTSSAVHNLLQLQIFIGLLALTTLILAAVIAERRSAESALTLSRQQHRDIVHFASVGVYQTDPIGEILLANPALARILGYDDPGHLVGRNVAKEVYWDQTEHASLLERFELGDGSGIEMQWKCRDGSPTWVDLHARAVKDARGRTSYYEGFVYDLTSRKQLEKQFQQAQKMEAVGRLAGGVAHDFNNLLTVIGSCSDFILDDKDLAAGHRDDLLEVKKATDRATSLTRQLLALGRTQVLRPATINLNDRLLELLPMIKRLFETTIDIRIETDPALWAVRADPGQIEQVLLNLALNARDAMREGGVLTFTTENAVIAEERVRRDQEYTMKAGDYALLRVRDTGVGMDEDTQRKVFEPFFTTKEIGKGTGLGLATAYGIVKQSGGYIKVRSAPGDGAEFLIYLPRTRATPDRMVLQLPRDKRRGSGTVLVVEDEPAVQHSLQRILTADGYTVLTASNGTDALELFTARNRDIDLLITDLVMPGLGGRALAKECCALSDTLKVIYISGYTRDSLLSQQTFEEGTEFIEKPFTREIILDRIGRVLRG